MRENSAAKKEDLAVHGGKKTVPAGLKIKWPIVTQEDKDAVIKTLDEEILHGPYVPEVVALEKDFAEYIGTKYCIATNSGTAALHMAIAAAGIGPGDEVITSSYTFLSSATSALHHNAIPVFVDIDPRTFTIDPGKIEEKISSKTRAIIPVHIHGIPADMDRIRKIAQKYNLIVIEDACQAPGATYNGKKVGNFGDMAAFSLNVTKNLPGIEGGLLITSNKKYRDEANMLRMFGEEIRQGERREYNAYGMGWMYRTFGMPAAFARRQLKKLDEYNANAQKNAWFLSKQLAEIKGIIPPFVPEDRTSIYHKYRVRLNLSELGTDLKVSKLRDKAMKALQAEGVDVVLWQSFPVPGQTLFQLKEGYGRGCPWSCPYYDKEITYEVQDYPETVRLLNDSFIVCSEPFPIYAQRLELMKYYAEGFRKVFDNLEEVLEAV
ncbi:MAG: DegT/DnrJ/EryC1/StrS family aminotransferase [Candidatus Aerophobetes bacterium]|nr:DegT/DnrJ/EryC1/StrS family aminotransferase [Candidatus Aerophobetes bacterium]